jgi:hypothetical protein
MEEDPTENSLASAGTRLVSISAIHLCEGEAPRGSTQRDSYFKRGETGRCPRQTLIATETEAIVEDEQDEDALYAAQEQYGMAPAPDKHSMMTAAQVSVFFARGDL